MMDEVMLIKTLITATLNFAKRQNCDGKNYDDDEWGDVDQNINNRDSWFGKAAKLWW